MKKILSTFMLLLVISSNCFYYSFANNEEFLESHEIDFNEMDDNSESLGNLDSSLPDSSEPQDNEINEELMINNEEFLEAFEDDFDETQMMNDEPVDNNFDSSSILELEELSNDKEQQEQESDFEENLQVENEETRYVYDDCDICDYCYDDEDCILFCNNECSNNGERSGDNEEIELPNLIISEVFFG